MNKILKRSANRSRAGDIGIYLLLIVFGAFFALPLIYVIMNAFKPLDEFFVFPPNFIVRNPTLDNFMDLFILIGRSWVPFTRYIFNSLSITFLGTVGHVIIASMGAFVLAKYKFPGGQVFFRLVVTALILYGYVTAIPNYLIMTQLGWVDTYLAVIIPAFAAPMGLFLMKQFMEQVPDSLIEAAKIDGGNEWYVFISIVMPMVKPAWLTLVIFSIQGLWNNPQTTFIYSEELKMLPYALQQVLTVGAGVNSIARMGVAAVVSLFIMIVPIAVFLITQSNILETMASSGIKE
jgi:ABC-type glycerol-3-phosphate transport system permease component